VTLRCRVSRFLTMRAQDAPAVEFQGDPLVGADAAAMEAGGFGFVRGPRRKSMILECGP
jgi:hypothetical protein